MYTQEESSHPLINCIWRAIVRQAASYSDPANEYWSLAFTRHADGSFSAELYGPSLLPRTLDSHEGEAYWGIEFKAHVVLGGTGKDEILNADMLLAISGRHFTIGGRQYPVPDYDGLESLVDQLERDGVIFADERIRRALDGDDTGFSERSRQRRFKHTTGLTKKQVEQLQRARHAFFLLQSGSSAAEAALLAGYADQPHMTRSLRVLRGETPAQIIAAHLKRT